VRFAIVLLLLMFILFAYVTTKSFQGRETFGNPYLIISPWRPVWTMLVPSIWIIVLYLPRMNRYCRQISEPAHGA